MLTTLEIREYIADNMLDFDWRFEKAKEKYFVSYLSFEWIAKGFTADCWKYFEDFCTENNLEFDEVRELLNIDSVEDILFD